MTLLCSLTENRHVNDMSVTLSINSVKTSTSVFHVWHSNAILVFLHAVDGSYGSMAWALAWP